MHKKLKAMRYDDMWNKDYTGNNTIVPDLLAWAYEKDKHYGTTITSTF